MHSGDIRVDVQSAVAMLAPYWGLSQLLDISNEQVRADLARVSVTAMSFVAQSARGLGKQISEMLEDIRHRAEQFDAALFSKVRAIFGGNIRECVSGAAPISKEMSSTAFSRSAPCGSESVRRSNCRSAGLMARSRRDAVQ